jgi:K+-sensing histidine kinase KdpD
MKRLQKYPRYLPFLWAFLTVAVLGLDYLTGPFIRFPIFYLLPIAFVAWFHGRTWGLILAITMPLVRFYFLSLETAPWNMMEAGLNALIRIIIFSLFVVLIDRVASQTRALSEEVHALHGLLPICSRCKKIRDLENRWEPLEKYISEHSEASFTHSLCPDCLAEERRTLRRVGGKGLP